MSSWHDADGDGLEDDLKMLQEGLAAPYGIVAYRTTVAGSEANEFLVAHKPDIMHLVNERPNHSSDKTSAERWPKAGATTMTITTGPAELCATRKDASSSD